MKFLFKDNQYTPVEACVCALLAFFIFSCADAFAKWLIGEGFSNSFILTLTYIIGLIQLCLIMAVKGEFKNTLQTPNRWWHVLRGFVLLGMTFFLLKALGSVPLAAFYSIIFSVPFIVTIGSVFFFGDKVGIKDWLAIIIGFVGVLVILKPSGDAFTIDIGYLYTIATAIGVAAAALLARKIGQRERIYPFAFYIFIIVILGNLPFIDWSAIMSLSVFQWLAFIGYGTIMPVGIILLSSTYAKAPSVAYVAPFQYTQMLWGIIFGLFVFNEIPDNRVFVGSAIVIACGLYVLLHARHVKRKEVKSGQRL